MKEVIVIGSKGMLGAEVVSQFSNSDDYEIIRSDFSDPEGIDVTKSESISEFLDKTNADFVINCSAYTNVEAAEDPINQRLADDVNSKGVSNLAKACKSRNINLVHISTDYVFGDNKEEGYLEKYPHYSPPNYYGESKSKGEKEIIRLMDGLEESDFVIQQPKIYIVRTQTLFGKGAQNFIAKIIHFAKEKEYLEVVTDEIVKPTYTKDLAESIKFVVDTEPEGGIYHGTSEGYCSRYEFAKIILKEVGIKTPVRPTTLDKFARKATIPNYSLLINTKLPKLRDWRDMVADYIENVYKANK